jgi:serine/threonine protein kinase
MSEPSPVRFLGRYAMHDELASGGMATIHLGRLLGPVGFARTVAIKRLHPQYARDPQFVAMFVDEARLAARIRHQNVVPTLDVVALEGEIFLVMEYVHGESLSRLLAALDARGERVAPPIAAGIMHGVLQGLHAAHEARTEKGVPLEIVHRDVSPQNVLVGIDGLARVADFGVAKAVGRLQTTEDGDVKGKMGYMSPEQVESAPVDRRTDVWAAAVVLWELLMGKRLFGAANAAAVVYDILERTITPPGVGSPALDAVVMRGLARDPGERFQTAREMAMALEEALTPASPRAIGDWVEATARETLRARASLVEEMEAEGGGKRSSDGSLRRQLAVL